MKVSDNKNPLIKLLVGKMPSDKRPYLCIFSHFSKNNRVADYVSHYLRCLQQAGCDIVFVSTADSLPQCQVDELLTVCEMVVVRGNYGYDFGSYKCGIDLVNGELAGYSKLVLTNDSVYGPFNNISELINHGDSNELDVWGATDSFAISYHIQSYFIICKSNVFQSTAFNEFWGVVRWNQEAFRLKKQQIIDNYEIGMSTHFIDHGFRLGAFCSVSNIRRLIYDVVAKSLKDDPVVRRLLTSNISVCHNPTHFYWDILIKYFRFPFIKKELLHVNPVQINISDWDTLISSFSNYDVTLITRHLNELTGGDRNDQFAWLFKEVNTVVGIPIPYFLTQLLTVWPDLKEKMNIGTDTEDSILNSIAYWENPQRANSPQIEWPANNRFPDVLYEPDPGIVQDVGLCLTKGAGAVWRIRPDLQMDLHTYLGRQQFMYWRLTLGRREYRFLEPSQQEMAFLKAPCNAFDGKLSHLPNLARMLPVFYTQSACIVEQLERGKVETYEACWQANTEQLLPLLQEDSLHHKAEFVQLRITRPRGTHKPNGVNVVGVPNGQFGIGEDARTAARALMRAGFETTVCPAPIKASTVYKSEWTDDFVQVDPVAKTNLICLPAVDTYQLILKDWAAVLSGRYNICAWQWELPKWPERWMPLLNMADEIWAQSRFVQKVFESVTEKPVIYMPLAIDKPNFTPLGKAHFGLQERAYTFLSVFDCNSWIKRKNPMGAIRAFLAAFPPYRDDVCIVVKVMNSNRSSRDYQDLLSLAARDMRIVIIDQYLPRKEMLALIDACDVFVSLHRSEGFGRVIAEAMYIGKPVISTNFSGSIDFAFEDTAYLIDGPLVPLSPGDYVDFEGQYWMDPDVDLAASVFRKCMEAPEATTAMAERGRQFIIDYHSIFPVAVRYHDRLKSLGIG
jgi:glycosyltransferase involved in cell wall biosynthesis